ncbi:MAG: hypothetical protein K0U37_01735 [Gammaproteobacteria bacterium]|nr:hypothetical protein [Gammaproteobacteria bacterium]
MPIEKRTKHTVRRRPAAINTSSSSQSIGCVMMPANRRSATRAPIVLTPRQRNVARINQALRSNDSTVLLSLFRELGVNVDDSPTHQVSKKRSHDDISQASTSTISGDRRPSHSPGLSLFREFNRLDPCVGRRLVHAYFEEMSERESKTIFIQTVRDLDSEVLKTLFLPFRKHSGQASFYKLISNHRLNLLFEHLPIEELDKFVDMLISPRRVTSTEGVLFRVIRQLNARSASAPEEKPAINSMLEKLVDAGLSFHQGQGNHIVVSRLEHLSEMLESESVRRALAATSSSASIVPTA